MVEESALNRRFRENVRKEREEKGWSQGELSRRLIEAGWPVFHQTTITRIENGTRAVKLDEASVIAETLGVKLDTMMSDPWIYAFTRAEQQAWAFRRRLAKTGIEYMQHQASLHSAIDHCFDKLGEEELQRAKVILGETPGDAAMMGIDLLMENEPTSDYFEYRAFWRKMPREARRLKREAADKDA